MEICHIPGKINPIDNITKQVKTDDVVYSGEVKQLDHEFVDAIRIPMEATDRDVCKRNLISFTVKRAYVRR